MSNKSEGTRKKWWIVSAVVGVTIVGVALVMRPADSAKPITDASTASTRDGLVILPQAPLTFHALRVGGALVAAGNLGGMSSFGQNHRQATVVWSVDGREVHRGDELDASLFRRGDLVEARLQETGPDGSAKILGQASVRVGNARPKVQSVTVQRDEDDPRWLQAHVRTIDADDDPLTVEYRWTADGEAIGGAEGNRVLSDDLQPGQKICVEVTASDGDLRSEPLRCKPFSIDNHPPALVAGASPEMERLENGDLVAHMSVTGSDPDDDEWAVELIEAPSGFQWDEQSHRLSWTISSGEEMVDVTLRVTDARGASAQRTFRVRR